VVDRESRTFAFYLPLENQWQAYAKDSGSRLLWRFQPGTRVRLRVPVESFSDVFVVPRDAIVREAGEVYVFVKQIGKFRRQSVRLLSEDRKYAVLRPSAELRSGTYVVTQAAAALNRILKSRQGGDSGGHGHDHGHAH
jgi:hypothetical protein